jgi:hypothetical protein
MGSFGCYEKAMKLTEDEESNVRMNKGQRSFIATNENHIYHKPDCL